MKTKLMFSFIMFVAVYQVVYSQPALTLPVETGYRYRVTVGYGGSSIFKNKDGSSYIDPYHSDNSYYSLDFDNPTSPTVYESAKIIAVASGTVTTSENSSCAGNHITINHGDGYTSEYLHLSSRSVEVNASVTAGQEIGVMGATGTCCAGSHLHFVLKHNGVSVNPEPMSGYSFIVGNYYTSGPGVYNNGWHDTVTYPDDPSQPFINLYLDPNNDGTRADNEGYNTFGVPQDKGGSNKVHVWPTNGDPSDPDVCVLQDYEPNNHWIQLVLTHNKFQARPVYGQILTFWHNNTGYDNYGPPLNKRQTGLYIGGNLGSNNDEVVVQKFYMTGSTIKTIAFRKSDSTSTIGHYSLGLVNLDGISGDNWYVDDNENGQVDTGTDRLIGQVGSSGQVKKWFDQDSYVFLRQRSGQSLASVAHYVVEGNNQFIDLTTTPPSSPVAISNLSATVDGDHVDLSWSDANSPSASPYKVYRNSEEIAQVTQTSYTDDTIVPGNTYAYTVSGNGTPESVGVYAIISGDGSGGGAISGQIMTLSTDNLDFGLISDELTFTIDSETSPEDINWNTSPSDNWITCSPSSGESDDEVTVTVSRSGLSAGVHQGSITVNSNAGSKIIVVSCEVYSTWATEQSYYFTSNYDGWQLLDRDEGASGLDNGRLKIAAEYHGLSQAMLCGSGANFSAVDMTFSIDKGGSTSGNEDTEIYFCYHDPQNYYAWHNHEDSDNTNYIELAKYVNSTKTQLWTQNGALPNGRYHLTYSGGTMRLVDASDSTNFDSGNRTDTTFIYGKVGFGVNEEIAWLDSVIVDGVTANLLAAEESALDYGSDLTDITLHLSSLSSESIAWHKESGPEWLDLSSTTGVTGDSIVVSLDRENMACGSYSDTLIIASNAGSLVLPVTAYQGEVVLSDDFNDGVLGDEWDVNAGALIDNYKLKVYTPSSDGRAWATGAGSLTNASVEFDWSVGDPGEANRDTYVFLRYTDEGNAYQLAIAGDTRNQKQEHVRITRISSSQGTELLRQNIGLSTGRYRFSVNDDTLKFTNVNGSGSTINMSTVSTISLNAGQVVFGVNEQIAYFDNIVITDLDATPTMTVIATCDNRFQMWINGNSMGAEDSDWETAHTYQAPVIPGENVIAVKAKDDYGIASFIAHITTSSNNTYLSSANWKVSTTLQSNWTEVSFDDSAWSNATSVGTYGISPWYQNSSGFPSSQAHWIWSDESCDDDSVFLRFTFTDTPSEPPEDYTDSPNNLFTNGQANDPTFISDYPGINGWYRTPNGKVTFTDDALWGEYSLQVTNDEAQSSNNDVRFSQVVSVDSGTTYDVCALFNNSTGITGTFYLTNYQYYGCWCWQNLWWQGSLQSGRHMISTSFTPQVNGNVVIEFWFGNVVGTTRVDSLILKEQGLQKKLASQVATLLKEFSIANYPNPFNPETRLKYSLPEATHVKLEIFNILGQKVVTLVDVKKEAGWHEVIWNGLSQASGIYIYRFEAGNFHQTKRMLLLK